MKKVIELFQGRARSITSFLDNLDINAETVAKINKLGEKAFKIYNELHGTIKNEEEYKKLSPIEQQALHENTRTYAELLTAMNQELAYLLQSKHPLALGDCLGKITEVNMLFDHIIDRWGGQDGKFKYSTLKHVREKGWEKIKYKDKIFNLSTELDLLTEDVGAQLNDNPILMEPTERTVLNDIYVSLVVALAWLNSEYDRIEKEGMPEAREFTLPELQVPKIPEDGEKDQPEKTEG